MTQTNNRYHVEQRALPEAFYNKGDALLKTMMNDEGRAMESFYKRSNSVRGNRSCPYKRSAFSLRFQEYINCGHSVFIVGIRMPQPETPQQCRAIYLCYGGQDGSTLYIASQLDKDGRYGLCVLTKNNERLTYSLTGEDEFEAVAKTYWNFTLGSKKQLIPQLMASAACMSA